MGCGADPPQAHVSRCDTSQPLHPCPPPQSTQKQHETTTCTVTVRLHARDARQQAPGGWEVARGGGRTDISRLKSHEKPLAMAPSATFAKRQPFGALVSTFGASFEPLKISDRRTRNHQRPRRPGQFAWTAGRPDPVAARSRGTACMRACVGTRSAGLAWHSSEVTSLCYSQHCLTPELARSNRGAGTP